MTWKPFSDFVNSVSNFMKLSTGSFQQILKYFLKCSHFGLKRTSNVQRQCATLHYFWSENFSKEPRVKIEQSQLT